jgi:hypothetical protein
MESCLRERTYIEERKPRGLTAYTVLGRIFYETVACGVGVTDGAHITRFWKPCERLPIAAQLDRCSFE